MPAGPDKVGLTRITFSVNGRSQEAVVDTGANLSVLSAAAARRLGVTVLEGGTDVGNGVQGTVPTRVGIAARIEIAGTVMTDVPFLIIEDANLTFPQVPGGYHIPAIIGLPELRALGRVRIEQAGRFVVLPPAEAGAPNLVASGNDLFAEVSIDGRPVPLHLDTGENQTGAALNNIAILRAEGLAISPPGPSRRGSGSRRQGGRRPASRGRRSRRCFPSRRGRGRGTR